MENLSNEGETLLAEYEANIINDIPDSIVTEIEGDINLMNSDLWEHAKNENYDKRI